MLGLTGGGALSHSATAPRQQPAPIGEGVGWGAMGGLPEQCVCHIQSIPPQQTCLDCFPETPQAAPDQYIGFAAAQVI
jgi:hypothetical protein